MRITIVKNEIEEAIKEYISRQITVRSGQVISIKLTKEEAEITITKGEHMPAHRGSEDDHLSEAFISRSRKAVAQAEPEEETPAEEAPFESDAQSAESTSEAATEEASSAPEQTEAADTGSATEAPKSLFGHLTKPVNS